MQVHGVGKLRTKYLNFSKYIYAIKLLKVCFNKLPRFPFLRCSLERVMCNFFWIFMLFQAVNTVKLNFKAGLFSSTFPFEHSFLAKSRNIISDTPKMPISTLLFLMFFPCIFPCKLTLRFIQERVLKLKN